MAKNIYDYFTTEHRNPANYTYKYEDSADKYYVHDLDELIIPEEDKNLYIFLHSKFTNDDKLNFIVKCIKNNENFGVVVRFLNANKDNLHAMSYIWTEINRK